MKRRIWAGVVVVMSMSGLAFSSPLPEGASCTVSICNVNDPGDVINFSDIAFGYQTTLETAIPMWFNGSDDGDGYWSASDSPVWYNLFNGKKNAFTITIDLGQEYDLTYVGMRWWNHAVSNWGTPQMNPAISTNGTDWTVKDTTENWGYVIPWQDSGSWAKGVAEYGRTLNDRTRYIRFETPIGAAVPSQHGSIAEINFTGSPVAGLTFSPDGGTIMGPQTVVISCATPSAVIRYTTDGSEPAEGHGEVIASGGTVSVGQDQTLKARAWVDGIPGLMKSAEYRAPTALPAGAVCTVDIRNKYDYSEVIDFNTITYNQTLAATIPMWFNGQDDGDGYWSPTDAPCWSNFNSDTGKRHAFIITIDLGREYDLSYAGIRWWNHSVSNWGTPQMNLDISSNGTDWTTKGFQFVPWRDHTSWDKGVTQDGVVLNGRARFFRFQTLDWFAIPNQASSIAEIIFSGSYVAMPTDLIFSVPGGAYTAVQNVTVTCLTPTAVIRYTLDGSDPTETNGTPIASGSSIAVDHSLTLKARAWVDGAAGQMIAADYALTAAAPVFSPAGSFISAPKSITLISATPEAGIRYTLDGSDPTATTGILIASGGSVPVDNGVTLKALAVRSGFAASPVVSRTYTIPASYNRPETISYTSGVTVDGYLSDWADATWIPLNQSYDYIGAPDVSQASYAAKWGDNGNKIYVAVRVLDTAYSFTDACGAWDGRDAVEIYLHTTSTGPTSYYINREESAQQWIVGIMGSNHNQVWTSLTDSGSVPAGSGFTAAGHAEVDGWITYEVAMTPYEFYGGVTGQPSIISTLHAEDVIGLDVCVVGHDGSDYSGMKSENLKRGKSGNWLQIGLHKLVLDRIAGDANGDRKVDVSDLGILAANYGTTAGAIWEKGDFNGDGKVDVSDLGILAANYGRGTGSSSDFNTDARALGLALTEDVAAKEETPVSSTLGCGALGLPLVAGILAIGLCLVKLDD